MNPPLPDSICKEEMQNATIENDVIIEYCARAQLISQHVDAGQLTIPPQQQPITLNPTRVMLN